MRKEKLAPKDLLAVFDYENGMLYWKNTRKIVSYPLPKISK